MCIELQYTYPQCGCLWKVGFYVCWEQKNNTTKPGFDENCSAFKTTTQKSKLCQMSCDKHSKPPEYEGEMGEIGSDEDEETLKVIEAMDKELAVLEAEAKERDMGV